MRTRLVNPVFHVLLIVLALGGCAAITPQEDRPADKSMAPAAFERWPALSPIADRNVLVPLNEGKTALNWRLQLLQSATQSIDLQTFIWRTDATGNAILAAVLDAAGRGVKVRVLLDDSFLAHADPVLHAVAQHPNIRYRIYNPAANRAGGTVTRQLANITEFNRLNHRMHNKLLLVDGRVGIVGGRNQADEYFGLRQQQNFRDMEVLL